MLTAQWQGNSEVRPQPAADPTPGPGEALIEVEWCGICGSDLHAFRDGRGVSPGHVFGHELSGRVLAAPGVPDLEVGDLVVARPVLACGTCRRCFAGDVNLCERQILLGFDVPGGMAERFVLPRAAGVDAVLKLPPTLGLREAALVEPLAVGLRTARLADPMPGDRGLVIGCGPIGLGAIRFLADIGVQPLVASDPSPLRRQTALAMGATDAHDPLADDPPPTDFDFAVDAAGVEPALSAAIRSVRAGGRVVVVALHGTKVPVSIDRIVSGEVILRGSFAYQDELRRVLDLMGAGRIDATAMITHEFALAEAQEAFDTQMRADEAVKVMLRIGSTPD